MVMTVDGSLLDNNTGHGMIGFTIYDKDAIDPRRGRVIFKEDKDWPNRQPGMNF
jgi:hypothetical protein